MWLPGGHAWLLGGMRGCQGACVVAREGMCGCRGACIVAGGCAWLPGGVWLLGACVVAGGHVWLPGGMYGSG